MLTQAPIQMAEMAKMAAQTEPMRVLAASAGRVAVAGMREDMMVLPGRVELNSYPYAVNVVCRRWITPATS